MKVIDLFRKKNQKMDNNKGDLNMDIIYEGVEPDHIKSATKKLHELKNDVWLEDGEDPVTEKTFLESISIKALSISDDGRSFDVYYDDGDLFWGHSIVCTVNDNKIEYVTLEG
jgi:hypothetical protein